MTIIFTFISRMLINVVWKINNLILALNLLHWSIWRAASSFLLLAIAFQFLFTFWNSFTTKLRTVFQQLVTDWSRHFKIQWKHALNTFYSYAGTIINWAENLMLEKIVKTYIYCRFIHLMPITKHDIRAGSKSCLILKSRLKHIGKESWYWRLDGTM